MAIFLTFKVIAFNYPLSGVHLSPSVSTVEFFKLTPPP
jgi:hypothetical protein